MTFLVPEIHPGNVVFYWILSFVARVESLCFHPMCAGLAGTRIRQIVGADAFSAEEGWAFRAGLVGTWETLSGRIPRADWQSSYRGVLLDFTSKAKQDLWRAFEDFHLLGAIQRNRGRDDVYLVRSTWVTYLARVAGAGELFAGGRVSGWASTAHRTLDRLWEGAQYAAGLARLAVRLLLAMLARLSSARPTLAPTSILYVCDNPNELHESPDKRSFTWLIDGARIRAADVLVLLPDFRDSRLKRLLHALPETGIQAGRIQDLYQRIPAAHLAPALAAALAQVPQAVVAPLWAAHRSLKGRYLLSGIEIDPLVRHVRPACYLETDSSMGIEKPALVYLQQLEIVTVMCHFSAMLLFYTRPGGRVARDCVIAHPLASRVLCWNEHAADLVRAHAHEGAEITVLGPVMPGRDDVLAEDRSTLRSRALPAAKAASFAGRQWVSVFDVMPNPTPRARRPRIRAYDEPYTEEYWVAFMRDMLQLLDDDPDLALIFKPKRVHVVGRLYSVSAWFPTRDHEYAQLMDAFHSHERAVVLDEDVNPWIPVAVADLCISPPGGSPVCVGWHFGIPGIYHDPLGLLGPEDHQGMRSCLTSDYPMLRAKARGFLHSAEPGRSAGAWDPAVLRQYVGRTPGSNANAEFRTFLSGLAQRRRAPRSTSEVVAPQPHGIQ